MKSFYLIILVLALSVTGFSQAGTMEVLQGIVKDSNDSLVSNAKIQIVMKSGEIYDCNSEESGKFQCQIKKSENFTLTVRVDGFSILRRNFTNTQDLSEEFEFVLYPLRVNENVIVSVNRTETLLSETPASVATISKEKINSTASPATDDILRQTAGFTLFRRSNSRHANPTTQGTSLRGVNASGASRSQILFDSVPLNDIFGGWVGWSRATPIGIEQIEVLRGGSSSLYGSDSLGGTINIVPRRIPESKNYFIAAEIFGGTQKTISGSTFLGVSAGDWTFDLTAATYQSQGYRPIDKAVRGEIDDFANSHNLNISTRIAKSFEGNSSVFLKASYFGEARNNGTPIQKNRTHLRQFAAGGDFIISDANSPVPDYFSDLKVKFRAFGGTQVFDQTFSAIDDDRNGESLVRLQRVPAQSFGTTVQFSTVYQAQTFLAGIEFNEIRGASNEIGYFGGAPSSMLGAGGRERSYAVYFQDFAKIGEKLILVGNVRFDVWKNSRALSSTLRFSNGQITTQDFPDRRETAFSPGASLMFRATPQFSFYLNASRNFRAPTLNELYRGFRVGDIVTNPNENLRAEKANNFEGGISYGKDGFYSRANFYWTEVSGAVSNVTINSTPGLITRMRQNTGKIRVRGLEIEAEKRFGDLDVSFGFLFADAIVAEFPTNMAIVGLRIPQVPVYQLTFQTNYRPGGGWSLSFQGRVSSSQFDDDLNTFRLEPYVQLDVFAARRFKKEWQVFVGIENIFNSRYSIGKTPLRTVSSPINARIGLRWN